MSTARLSLNTATTKYWTLEEAVRGAAEAGIEAVGLWRDRVAEAGLDRAAELVKQYGLRVSSLCRGGFMTAADPDGIAAALADNRNAIIEAATLGTRELVMVVGGLPAAPGPELPATADGDRDLVAARQRVADRVGELVGFAREHDVRLVLEPMNPIFAADRGVLSTLEQCLDMAADFDARDVGVVVDTYHVWWDPKLEQMIKRAAAEDRLASYQVNDWVLPLQAETLLSRGHVGDGYVDFATITRWVIEAGYTGDIEVEIFNRAIWETPGEQTLATMIERHTRFIEPYLG